MALLGWLRCALDRFKRYDFEPGANGTVTARFTMLPSRSDARWAIPMRSFLTFGRRFYFVPAQLRFPRNQTSYIAVMLQ